jgi:TPR repeat protein
VRNHDIFLIGKLASLGRRSFGTATDFTPVAFWYSSEQVSTGFLLTTEGSMNLKHLRSIYTRMAMILGLTTALLTTTLDQARGGPHEAGDAALAAGDYKAALASYQQAAAAGNHWSENSIGSMYEKGLGLAKQPAKACEWYRKAAAGENPWGQYNYGRCFDEGLSGGKDAATAIKWFNLAAAQGNPWANYRLGQMHSTGEGMPKDREKGLAYYLKAAENGNDWAQYAAAEYYSIKAGKMPDMKAAVKWYRASAAQKNQWAAYKLALLLIEGRYVTKDIPQAKSLLDMAAAQGNKAAKKTLSSLK